MSEDSNRGSKSVIIIVLLVVVLVVAGAWYFFMYKPEQEAKEKARQEQLAKERAEKKRKEEAAQRKAKYDQLIKDADTEFTQENWQTAKTLYSEASSLFSKEQYPKDQLALVQAKLDEIDALEIKKQGGGVEVVSGATDRYYVVISSSIDDDLAMDYAKKLAKDGNYVKVLEPYGSHKPFYRVSLADYDTSDQAEAAKSSFGEFATEVWVLKY